MNLNDLILNIQMTQRMMIGGCIALAALLSITFGYSLWQWHDDWAFIHQSPTAAVVSNEEQASHVIASIPEDHIFGKSIGQLPITNLQMSITGIVTVSSQSGLPSKAYISIDGQPSKVYKAGDDLPYGVKINAITNDTVILEHDGQFEKLLLQREKLQFKPRTKEFD